jgi:hypothetical protein
LGALAASKPRVFFKDPKAAHGLADSSVKRNLLRRLFALRKTAMAISAYDRPGAGTPTFFSLEQEFTSRRDLTILGFRVELLSLLEGKLSPSTVPLYDQSLLQIAAVMGGFGIEIAHYVSR